MLELVQEIGDVFNPFEGVPTLEELESSAIAE
jgi:hypothetical protein